MAGFRPEYIDAVAASRWSLRLIPLLLLAPTLFAFTTYKRNNAWIKTVTVFGCVIFTWLSLCIDVEQIWNTMELNAQTDAEWEDVTADTGCLYGPILVGLPFAIIYTFTGLAGGEFGLVERNLPAALNLLSCPRNSRRGSHRQSTLTSVTERARPETPENQPIIFG